MPVASTSTWSLADLLPASGPLAHLYAPAHATPHNPDPAAAAPAGLALLVLTAIAQKLLRMGIPAPAPWRHASAGCVWGRASPHPMAIGGSQPRACTVDICHQYMGLEGPIGRCSCRELRRYATPGRSGAPAERPRPGDAATAPQPWAPSLWPSADGNPPLCIGSACLMMQGQDPPAINATPILHNPNQSTIL